MNKRLPKAVLAILTLAAVTSSSHAQEKARSIQFSCVIWKPLPFETVYYRQGETYLPLKLSPGNRSELYELKGSSALLIYTQEKNEEGDIAYKLVGKSSIPAGMERMLFFLTERSDPGELPLRLSGIDDSLLSFPRGSCRFVNMTSVPLAVSFAGKRSIIKPRAMTVLDSKVSTGGGMLQFWIHDRDGNNLYENRYLASHIGRDMFFILPPNKRGGRVNIRLLPQLLAPPPKENGQRPEVEPPLEPSAAPGDPEYYEELPEVEPPLEPSAVKPPED